MYVRRAAKIIGGLALLAVVLALTTVARGVFFPPHFDVTSIATLPAYQERALLERAWQLPVAAAYHGHVDFQSNGSTCGPTSGANLLRSLGESATTVDAVLEGTGKCSLGICLGGLSLDELAGVLRGKTHHTVTVLRDLSMAEFREHLRRSNDPSRRYLINFQRGLLFGKGTGHHSPIGGYLEDRDLVFVLDVNAKFGPWLVPAERLYRAMDSLDSSTHRKRGMLLVE